MGKNFWGRQDIVAVGHYGERKGRILETVTPD